MRMQKKIRNEKMLIIQIRHEQPHYISFSGQKKMDLLFFWIGWFGLVGIAWKNKNCQGIFFLFL